MKTLLVSQRRKKLFRARGATGDHQVKFVWRKSHSYGVTVKTGGAPAPGAPVVVTPLNSDLCCQNQKLWQKSTISMFDRPLFYHKLLLNYPCHVILSLVFNTTLKLFSSYHKQ